MGCAAVLEGAASMIDGYGPSPPRGRAVAGNSPGSSTLTGTGGIHRSVRSVRCGSAKYSPRSASIAAYTEFSLFDRLANRLAQARPSGRGKPAPTV